ncbi:MAG: Bacterial regulatory protein luxR family [Devosia sp.]|nr:Bacterial regulatory protein luxR family [Devosia sp.]
MHLTAQGKSNKDIAQALGLAEVTVKVHVNALFRNLNITTEPKRPR